MLAVANFGCMKTTTAVQTYKLTYKVREREREERTKKKYARIKMDVFYCVGNQFEPICWFSVAEMHRKRSEIKSNCIFAVNFVGI